MRSPHRDQRISSAQLMENCAFLVCWRLGLGPKPKPGFLQSSKQHTPHKLLLKYRPVTATHIQLSKHFGWSLIGLKYCL